MATTRTPRRSPITVSSPDLSCARSDPSHGHEHIGAVVGSSEYREAWCCAAPRAPGTRAPGWLWRWLHGTLALSPPVVYPMHGTLPRTRDFPAPEPTKHRFRRSSATGPQGVPGVPPRYRGRPGGRLGRSPPLKLENCSRLFSPDKPDSVFFLHADPSHTVEGILHTTFLIPVS